MCLTREQISQLEVLREDLKRAGIQSRDFMPRMVNILLAEEDQTETEDGLSSVTLTQKRTIKLFRKLLKGRPVELTDASPETATIREILEAEVVVFIAPKSGKIDPDEEQEYDLSGSVFWSKDKNKVVINFE